MNDDEDPYLEPPPPLNTAFLLMLALAAPLMHLVVFLFLGSLGMPPGVATAGMASIATYGALFALCARRIEEPVPLRLGFVPAPRVAWTAVAFLLWAAVLTSEIDNVVRAVFPLPETISNAPVEDERPASFGVALGIVYVVVFPLAYELFFRGAMQPVLVAELGARYGVTLTAVLCGFSFAMGLGNPWAILPSIFSALVLGILRFCSGSLGPGLLLHALWGLATLMASYGLMGIPGFDDTSVAHTPLVWLVVAALFTGIGLRLCRVAANAPLVEAREPEED